ncbi:MarR family transcriptional regulator [Embleya sp. NPDC050154]|uniref:MarR family transcriptional regulator n=1 Tax=Embleya sp. NPDC050154 TaxID=3363988 RepID=UPI00378B1E8F
MHRILSSTTTTIDGIDPAHEDTYVAAVQAELPHATRETYSLDGIGQKEYHIAVVPYTDPIQDSPRFAVYYTDPAHTEISDHDTYLDAEREYENLVIAGIENYDTEVDEDGNEIPAYAETDVEPSVVAAHRAAEKAEAARREAQADAEAKAMQRAVAVAGLVDAYDAIERRGGLTEAARRLGLEKATVSALVKKARTGTGAESPARRYNWELTAPMMGVAHSAGSVYAPDLEQASILAFAASGTEPFDGSRDDAWTLAVDRAGKAAPLGGWISYNEGETHYVTPTT